MPKLSVLDLSAPSVVIVYRQKSSCPTNRLRASPVAFGLRPYHGSHPSDTLLFVEPAWVRQLVEFSWRLHSSRMCRNGFGMSREVCSYRRSLSGRGCWPGLERHTEAGIETMNFSAVTIPALVGHAEEGIVRKLGPDAELGD